MAKIASDKPVVTILTLLAASVAIIVGGIVTITNPQTLTFHQYIQDIAFMAGALGLGSGIGRGIDSYGQAIAQAQAPPPGPPSMTTATATSIPIAIDEPPPDDR